MSKLYIQKYKDQNGMFEIAYPATIAEGVGLNNFESLSDLDNLPKITSSTTVLDAIEILEGKTRKIDNEMATKASLAKVATSGSYNDLSNKPTIPTKISDLEDDSDFVKTGENVEEANHASSANKATNDALDQRIDSTYIKSIEIQGTTVTITKGDKTTTTQQTQDTTYTDMVGATSSTAGNSGLVPAPSAGDDGRYLSSDGTWKVPPDTNTTYEEATTSKSGLMSYTDKAKLNGIDSGANHYTLPAATADILGGIKIGDNISSDNGVISINKENIASALGYTPANDSVENEATTTTPGLMSAADKEKLDTIDINANAYTHPTYTAKTSGLYKITVDALGHVSDSIDVTKSDITDLGIPAQDTTYELVTDDTDGLMASSDKVKLDNIAEGANNYTHPAYTAKTSGLYKVTVDSTGHVSATTNVVKADITGLGIPAQDTTYSDATSTTHGLMSADDKEKLDTVARNANAYTHPTHTSASSGLYKISVDNLGHVTETVKVDKSDITDLGIPSQDTTYFDATTTVSGLMSGADKAKLDGIATGAQTGTVTTVSTGIGLVGGDVITTGTIKAKLKSETPHTADSATPSNTASRQYAVGVDKSGYLSVNVPWSNTTYTAMTAAEATTGTATTARSITAKVLHDKIGELLPTGVTTTTSGLMSATDKTKLDGIASGAQTGTVTTVSTGIGLTGGDVTTTGTIKAKLKSETAHTLDSATPSNTASRQYAVGVDKSGFLSVNVPWSNTTTLTSMTGTLGIDHGGTGATTAVGALTNLGLTATATELNTLDGITATTAELNYTDGVTSNIQTQLNAKAPKASPALTGTPTAPTAAAGTNTTQIATTAFVNTAVSNGISSIPAANITGVISVDNLPAAALERCVVVANETARFKLTINDVQLGDTVKQNDTGLMYMVVDTSKLNSAAGYEVYTAGSAASVPWSGITSKPTTISGYGISDAVNTSDVINIAHGGTGATTAATALTNLGLTATATELNYMKGVTSSVQTQLNGKAASSHGTHVTYGTANPAAAGTASPGTATTVSRSDHVHPLQTTITGNAGSATKLANSNAIDGVNFNGEAGITHYGSCSTAAATVEKVVDCVGYTLVTGSRIIIKFTVTNTATSPTLNVNSTGAKAIYYRGSAISAGYLAANRTYEFVYNGTQYELVGDVNTNTTYSAMTAAEATTGTATTSRTITAKVLNDKITEKINAINTGVLSVTEGSTNGTISVDGTDVSVKGLGTAAYTASTDYLGASATAADSSKLGGTAATSYAKLASPTFTGTPKAPTATTGTNTTQIATTAFVTTAVSGKADTSHTHTTADVTALTGYAIASSAAAIAATDSLNTALGKLQKSIDGKQASGSYLTASSTLDATKLSGTIPTSCYTNTTYSNMTAATASAAGKAGLVPAPAAGKQASFLRGDGTWVVPTNTTYSNFVRSGTGAAAGLVPSPGTTAGTTKFLREDATWVVPTDTKVTATTTEPTSSTSWYPISGTSSSTATATTVKNASIVFKVLQGTADAEGHARLYLGNGTASGTAGNKTGALLMYGSAGKYDVIYPGSADTANRTLYLPKAGGTFVVHTTGTAIGGAAAPAYISSAGVATACTMATAADATALSVTTLFSAYSSSANYVVGDKCYVLSGTTYTIYRCKAVSSTGYATTGSMASGEWETYTLS